MKNKKIHFIKLISYRGHECITAYHNQWDRIELVGYDKNGKRHEYDSNESDYGEWWGWARDHGFWYEHASLDYATLDIDFDKLEWE